MKQLKVGETTCGNELHVYWDCIRRGQNGRVRMPVVPLALIPNIDPCLGSLFCLQPFRNCYLCGRAECRSLLLTPFNLHSTTQPKYSACPGERRESKKLQAKSPGNEPVWIRKFCRVATDTPQLPLTTLLKIEGLFKIVHVTFRCMHGAILSSYRWGGNCSWREQYVWILDEDFASLKSTGLAVLPSASYPVKAQQHASLGASFCPAVLMFTGLYITLIFTYNVCIGFFSSF